MWRGVNFTLLWRKVYNLESCVQIYIFVNVCFATQQTEAVLAEMQRDKPPMEY